MPATARIGSSDPDSPVARQQTWIIGRLAAMRTHWWKIATSPLIVACLAYAGWVLTQPAPPPTGYVSQTGLDGAQPLSVPLPSPTTSEKLAIFVGDSYTQTTNSYALQTCDRFGWICVRDAQGSTGYVADGHRLSPHFTPYLGRLAKTAAKYRPDYVFITGGRNDTPDIKTKAPEYMKAAKAAYPQARIFVLAPFWNTSPAPTGIQEYRQWVHAGAKAIDATWINTDGWLSLDLIGPDHVHPAPEGQDQLADHLIDVLEKDGITSSGSTGS